MKVADWLANCALCRVDALVVLREFAGLSHAAVLAHPDALLDAQILARLQDVAARRRAGEPLAYILGWREFYGLRLSVNPAVLVPRPETELVVDFVLQRLPVHSQAHVLDLGTGSGAIALAVAHARAHARVWAVDASEHALAVAEHNARDLLAAGREGGALRLSRSDWFAGLPEDAPLFHFIVSNPPYIAQEDPHLQALQHEPQLALVGRPSVDGLADIRCIIADAPRHLAAGGFLVIEHGYDQADALRALMAAAGFCDVATECDLAGIGRLTWGVKPAR